MSITNASKLQQCTMKCTIYTPMKKDEEKSSNAPLIITSGPTPAEGFRLCRAFFALPKIHKISKEIKYDKYRFVINLQVLENIKSIIFTLSTSTHRRWLLKELLSEEVC